MSNHYLYTLLMDNIGKYKDAEPNLAKSTKDRLFEDTFQDMCAEYKLDDTPIFDFLIANPEVSLLVAIRIGIAAVSRLDDVYSGHREPPITSAMIATGVEHFLYGMMSSLDGNFFGPMNELITRIEQFEDPDYQKYIELRARFEGK